MPTQQELQAIAAQHDFFIGIDSDGCCFDSMELKHKECFIPNIIKHWDCQPVSKYAREASEFVNLYSKWRGVNRFPALVMTFDLLDAWPEVQARGWRSPACDSFREWVKTETKLGNPALQRAAAAGDAVLQRTLAWSEAVNQAVEEMVHDLPPFPLVTEFLQQASGQAELLVVSGTPGEALQREWAEHGIDGYVQAICGQEVGSKAQMLEWAAGGKYDPSHVLMLGDAPGDLKAAKAHHYLFFPILPGQEAASWERLYHEALARFFAGTYAGEYEAARIAEFDAVLPSKMRWQ
ncbi:MAG: HAD family hydrolase [Fimbriimonadaceae bacterium]|nr:HAD family hydrolase [Fimbriimonadaceae bacterium]